MDQMTQEPQILNSYPVMPEAPTPVNPMPTSVPNPGLIYASFGERFLALLLDSFVLIPVAIVIAIIFTPIKLAVADNALLKNLISLIVQITSFVISSIYYVYFTGSSGATIGKRVMKIKVIKVDGSVPGYTTAFLREVVGKFVSGATILLFGIGYLWMLWDPQKQCLHDKIASTFVVKSR